MDSLQAVIFDMDGVLLDTESVCFVCWERAATELGIHDIRGVYKKCVGTNVADTLDILHSAYGDDFAAERFYERTSELFHVVEAEQGLQLMPQVKACLQALQARGLRLAVASSTRTATVQRQLTASGIIGFFETLTCGDTVAHSKPAPDIYLKACASLALPPQSCIAVEDSPNGVRAARAAGMDCVLVPDQLQPTEEIKKLATVILHDLGELPQWVANASS